MIATLVALLGLGIVIASGFSAIEDKLEEINETLKKKLG